MQQVTQLGSGKNEGKEKSNIKNNMRKNKENLIEFKPNTFSLTTN